MPNEILKKFVEDLKAERESKKITLQQIANKTKIDIKFLSAIEEAKFDILPDLYIRAFIKEYALAIELNPNEVIEKYDSARRGKVEEKSIHEEKKETQLKEFESTKAEFENPQQAAVPIKKSNLNYALGAGAALVILILAYFLFIKESAPDLITEQTYDSSVEDEKPAFEIDSTSIKDSLANAAIPQNDSISLSVNTNKRVWVKVLSDNNLRFQGMVDANNKMDYNASKEFRVVVGNAGYVALALNGKPIKNIGKMGELRNLIINEDTVKGYTLTVPKKNENKSPSKN
jgi:cytoskeletal protein RodZ